MRKTLSKLLSVVLSVAMVFSSVVFTKVNVSAEMTTEQMVASAQYNLALKKGVQVAPSLQEGTTACVTDGKFTAGGDHAATTFRTAGTYYQVDLGEAYDLSTLDQLVVGYKENSDGDTPVKGYKIQISTNGLDFTDAKSVDGAHVKEACANNNLIEVTSLADAQGTAARYFRLYYPDSYDWGIQVTEIAVLDTDGNAAPVEVEKCADAAGVIVTSPDYNTISYTIQAGENQEDYRYIVYLINGVNDRIVGNGVEAGKEYIIENTFSGMWAIKVIACYNGAASEGITSERIHVDEIANLLNMGRNIANAYAGTHPSKIVEMKSIYDGHTLATAAAALDGRPGVGEGPDLAMRTGAGSPQYFVIDLGEYYYPSEMEQVMLAYTNASTYASDTKVEFSMDGTQYTEVGNKKGYVFAAKSANFCAYNRVPLNSLENYTEKAVRFVKITLSGGTNTYGYVVNEVCVLANTDEPAIYGSHILEASDIVVDASNFEKIKYSIVAGEGQEDATYVVSLAGQEVNTEAKAGVEYEYDGIEAGTYEIKVSTLEDNWLSKGIKKNVVVDGYINYVDTSLNLALQSKHSEINVTCGSDEASIIYDLGKEYNKDDVHSVILMYESIDDVATEYEIYVSATGEEGTYEKVFSAEDATYIAFPGAAKTVYSNDRLDMSAYTQDAIRYVKYHIIEGNCEKPYNEDGSINWGSDGYHMCELAVMGNENLIPEAPANVSATSPEYNTIVVKWDDIVDENAVYNIYIDGNVATTENAGVNEKTFTVNAGTHKIKVCAVVNGIESSSEEISITVMEEVTTEPPTETTTQPVTTKPSGNGETTGTITNPTPSANTTNVKKPGRTKITKTKVGKKKVSVKFKKVKGAAGYRIKYSLKSNFKKAKTVTTKKPKVTIKKLKKGKRYYIKVQAYKVVNGKKVYGKYSKKVRTKKIK